MYKVKALEGFSLKRFNEIKIIQRATSNDTDGHITKGDIFECNKDIALYLTNQEEQPNPVNRAVVEIISKK